MNLKSLKYLLFFDASTDPQSKKAYGTFLLIEEGTKFSLEHQTECVLFENSSSSKAELQTLLYVLDSVKTKRIKLNIYTDSNSIISLLSRRSALEKNNFRSKNKRILNQHLLYREFYSIMDQIDCNFIKIKGHSKSKDKNEIDRFFSLVDRASRKALRNDFGS